MWGLQGINRANHFLTTIICDKKEKVNEVNNIFYGNVCNLPRCEDNNGLFCGERATVASLPAGAILANRRQRRPYGNLYFI